MNKLSNLSDLEALRSFAKASLDKQQKKVLICAGTGCVR